MNLDDYECRKCHKGMYVPDGMDPLDEDVRFCESCAIEEIERLQSIVDRLPKTRDGVPIQVNDRLWTKYDERPVVVEYFRPLLAGRWSIFTNRGQRSDNECYSTREAVERPRSEGQ